jgi:cardiolipin synthase A/B
MLVLALAGCATPPPVYTGTATAMSQAPKQDRLAFLRAEDEHISHLRFHGGNRVTLLASGDGADDAMEQAIGAATTRIDMETYTFDPDRQAPFAKLLLDKSAEGVDVYLIYDAWGSVDVPARLFQALRAGHVHVLEFNPLGPNLRVPVDLNDRDHRKLLVVDGKIAFVGGVNISPVYHNPPPPPGSPENADTLPWVDEDVRIEGPAVAEFEHLFQQTWHEQNGPPMATPPAPLAQKPGSALVEAVAGTPGKHRTAIYQTLLLAIAQAHDSVQLTTGFFAPTPELLHTLERAARRGVDVSLIVPDHSTSWLTIAAGRADYGALLKAGVHIMERQGAVLHAKTALIDGDYAIIGSSNLDWRSVVYNNEIDAVVIDQTFGRELAAQFAQDAARSRTITLPDWENRPLAERLRELVAKMVEPLL